MSKKTFITSDKPEIRTPELPTVENAQPKIAPEKLLNALDFVKSLRSVEFSTAEVEKASVKAYASFAEYLRVKDDLDAKAIASLNLKADIKAYERASLRLTLAKWYQEEDEASDDRIPLLHFLSDKDSVSDTLKIATKDGAPALTKSTRFFTLSEWLDEECQAAEALDLISNSDDDAIKEEAKSFRKKYIVEDVETFTRAIGTLRVYVMGRLGFINVPKGFKGVPVASNGQIKRVLSTAFKAWTGSDLSFGSWTVDFVLQTTATYNAKRRAVKIQGDKYFVDLFGDLSRKVFNKLDSFDVIAKGVGFDEGFEKLDVPADEVAE